MLLHGPISPMLATPGRALPNGEGWVLEPKWDGWRAIAHVTSDGPRIFTRHGRGYHRRLPALNAALAKLPAGTVLDGELVCLQPLEGGRVCCRFDRLSGFLLDASPHRKRSDGLTVMLVAFDALAVAGRDLRRERWHERRDELEQLLGSADGVLRIPPLLEATAAVHEALRGGRLGGNRRQARDRPLPLWSAQPGLVEAEVASLDRAGSGKGGDGSAASGRTPTRVGGGGPPRGLRGRERRAPKGRFPCDVLRRADSERQPVTGTPW